MTDHSNGALGRKAGTLHPEHPDYKAWLRTLSPPTWSGVAPDPDFATHKQKIRWYDGFDGFVSHQSGPRR